MAQNVTLLGASYADVPAVQLPKTGGGSALFADPSVTTAVASDVAQGKNFLLADGSIGTGTASGGGSVDVEPLSVTQNGVYTAPSGTAYSPVTVNVSGGGSVEENDVIFIDYDGTILYSYSAADFANFTEMPANPSHTGLTAQGWNWTLADAKTYVASYGMLTIGQMYVTDDGKTRLYCNFDYNYLSPYLGIGVNGTVIVDWGDNSATSTLTGTSLTTNVYAHHTYASPGDYIITLEVTSGEFEVLGASSYSNLLKPTETATSTAVRVYSNCIKKIEFGTGIKVLGQYSFSQCHSISTITLPSGITNIGNYTFGYCYSLKSQTIPNTVIGTLGQYGFIYCQTLQRVSLSKGATAIGSGFFQYCTALKRVEIPNSFTGINTYLFQYCYTLEQAVIGTTGGTISNYAFDSCYSLRKFKTSSAILTFGTYAVRYCYSLSTITIPSHITGIGNNALASCFGLSEIHFKRNAPPTAGGTSTFSNLPANCIIYVPYSADHSVLNAYKSATNYPSASTYTYVEE